MSYLILIFRITFLCVLPKLVVVAILDILKIDYKRDIPEVNYDGIYIFVVLAMAPLLETLWNQSVFSWINSGYQGKYKITIISISTIFFTALHWGRPIESLAWIAWVGFLLQYFYIKCITEGINAYWVTAASHSLVNLSSFGFFFYFLYTS